MVYNDVKQGRRSSLCGNMQIRQSLLDARDFTAILDSLAALLLLRDTLLYGELPAPNPCTLSSKQCGDGQSADNTMSSSHTAHPSSGSTKYSTCMYCILYGWQRTGLCKQRMTAPASSNIAQHFAQKLTQRVTDSAGSAQYPAGAVSYELRGAGQAPSPLSRGPVAWQHLDSSMQDEQEPPLRGRDVLGIVRKAATCIDDSLMTCASMPRRACPAWQLLYHQLLPPYTLLPVSHFVS